MADRWNEGLFMFMMVGKEGFSVAAMSGCRLSEGFEWEATSITSLVKVCTSRLDVECKPSIV